MKKQHIKPSTALAIAIFASITVFSFSTAHAQIDLLVPATYQDSNTLFTTTGPNTIGAKHLQLEGNLFEYSLNHTFDFISNDNAITTNHIRQNIFGGNLGLRYGIGSRFELNLSLNGGLGKVDAKINDYNLNNKHILFNPVIGAKLVILDQSHGWVPQISIAGSTSIPYDRITNDTGTYHNWDSYYTLGLQFRNRLGDRWKLDYSISYRFNEDTNPHTNYASDIQDPLQFNIMARWLAAERLMVSFGLENTGGRAELMWQATPDLQLRAQANIVGALGEPATSKLETFALIGINWRLK